MRSINLNIDCEKSPRGINKGFHEVMTATTRKLRIYEVNDLKIVKKYLTNSECSYFDQIKIL